MQHRNQNQIADKAPLVANQQRVLMLGPLAAQAQPSLGQQSSAEQLRQQQQQQEAGSEAARRRARNQQQQALWREGPPVAEAVVAGASAQAESEARAGAGPAESEARAARPWEQTQGEPAGGRAAHGKHTQAGAPILRVSNRSPFAGRLWFFSCPFLLLWITGIT